MFSFFVYLIWTLTGSSASQAISGATLGDGDQMGGYFFNLKEAMINRLNIYIKLKKKIERDLLERERLSYQSEGTSSSRKLGATAFCHLQGRKNYQHTLRIY